MSAPPDADARERARLLAHRGLGTWSDRTAPLVEFRAAAAAAGRSLAESERADAVAAWLGEGPLDTTPVEGPFERIAVCGGVYSNHFALTAWLGDRRVAAADAVYCLGDLGAFGPEPERVRPLLAAGGVRCIQGNYEVALAGGASDCNCGYTDPRDNHFAELSYRYTASQCSTDFCRFMGELPARRRIRVGLHELLAVHGSPRRVNEFLFASTSPDAFLERLLDREHADGLLCTHTGLHWHRRLPSGRAVVNVGALGRPANDGNPAVWFAVVEARGDQLEVRLEPLAYDHPALAAAMRRERLPEEFVETILTGWWTTCLEILPAKERAAGRF